MNVTSSHHCPFSSSPIERELLQIEKELAPEKSTWQKFREVLTRWRGSLALCTGFALGVSGFKAKVRRWPRDLSLDAIARKVSTSTRNPLIGIALCGVAGVGVGFLALDLVAGLRGKRIILKDALSSKFDRLLIAMGLRHRFTKRSEDLPKIRCLMQREIASDQLLFPKALSTSASNALRHIANPCPISGRFPRFPVKDIRPRGDGSTGRIYDWAALHWVLEEPAGNRAIKILDDAQMEHFEFCDELCRKIHRILSDEKNVCSGDPIEALRTSIHTAERAKKDKSERWIQRAIHELVQIYGRVLQASHPGKDASETSKWMQKRFGDSSHGKKKTLSR